MVRGTSNRVLVRIKGAVRTPIDLIPVGHSIRKALKALSKDETGTATVATAEIAFATANLLSMGALSSPFQIPTIFETPPSLLANIGEGAELDFLEPLNTIEHGLTFAENAMMPAGAIVAFSEADSPVFQNSGSDQLEKPENLTEGITQMADPMTGNELSKPQQNLREIASLILFNIATEIPTLFIGGPLLLTIMKALPARQTTTGKTIADSFREPLKPKRIHPRPKGPTANDLKQRSRLNVSEAINRLSEIIFTSSEIALAGFDANIIGQIDDLLAHIDIARNIITEDRLRDGTLSISDRSDHVSILNKLETLTLYIKTALRKTGFTHRLALNIQTRLSTILDEFDGSDASHLEPMFSAFRQNQLHPRTMSESQALGAIVGGAVADAVTLPYEERLSDKPVNLQDIESRINATTTIKGSDDTLTPVATMRSLVQQGTLAPRHLANTLATLIPQIKVAGFGRSTKVAIRRVAEGRHWTQAGNRKNASGNGAAMRIGPIAILNYRDLEALKRNVIMASQITHSDYEAIAGALAVAFIQAKIYRNEYSAEHIIDHTRRFIGPGHVASTLKDVSTLLTQEDVTEEDALTVLGTGGVVWESVPSAIYLFLRHNDNYKEMIEAAVKAGGDVDTIASIAGGLFGALNGIDSIPLGWREKLEDGKEIEDLASKLYGTVNIQ